MKELLKVGEYSGEPDLSLAGFERRLAATRAAIRYRNPETGKPHFCHVKEYRAVYGQSVREMHNQVREMKGDDMNGGNDDEETDGRYWFERFDWIAMSVEIGVALFILVSFVRCAFKE